MSDRVLTSHAGSLPRPDDLVELNQCRGLGQLEDEAAYQQRLTEATAEVVARQHDIGIDIVNDGEYGHIAAARYDYGTW